jgi:DHA1 family multidrug resistance protein-like MFS transporter
MFLSPISEIPRIGRNPPYLYGFAAFFIVSIALAFVDSFPAIIVLRWLQGLAGSPALASGAASIEDIYDIYSAPYGYVWWIAAMYCGPAIGPPIAGYAVSDNWRWPLYEVIIMSGFILCLLPFLPETYPGTILLRRAQRLRNATGQKQYEYRTEAELHPTPFRKALFEALIRPLEITMKDPAVLYAALYGGLVYATYYSFFEAFPIVYLGTYGMTLGELGLVFLSLMTGCIIGLGAYYVYLRSWFIPRARKYHADKGKPVEQEQWLRPGLCGVWGPPAGLLLFAWAARADVPWVVPTIGINVWAAGSFCMFQSLICYVALAYPKYVASLFAANDFVRSIMAAAFVQFSHSMYVDLGVGKGVTVIAGLSGVGVAGMYGLYYFGAWLRARSQFTG